MALRKKSAPVKKITLEHGEFLSKMARLMYDSGGVGLAANQIGIDMSLAVLDTGEGLYKLVNPRIVKKEGTQILEEGCLSIPGVYIKVKRAKKVEVRAEDESGNPITIKAEGLMACCLQQEIDHLNGKMIIDYAPFLQKLRLKKALAKMKDSLK